MEEKYKEVLPCCYRQQFHVHSNKFARQQNNTYVVLQSKPEGKWKKKGFTVLKVFLKVKHSSADFSSAD